MRESSATEARERGARRLAARLVAAALTMLAAGCAQQELRDAAQADPRALAEAAIALDPGPPPARVVHALDLEPYKRKRAARRARARADEKQRTETVADAQPRDVWARIRERLRLPRDGRARIERELDWYRDNQDYLDRMAERARLYLPYIVRAVERRGLPSDLALLPVVESAFQPFAYSRAGASGIWQFIPSTGKLYGLKENWWYDGRRDIVEATRAALDYLEKLRDDFDGDWLLAIAAYNSGEGNVERAVARNRRRGKRTDFWSLRLPRETQSYVPRLLAVAEIVAAPERHGLRLLPISDEPPFRAVALDDQIDLGLAAEVTGVPLDTLHLLNPGFNRRASDPNGPQRLLLPTPVADRFAERLAAVPAERRVRWARHRVKRGDTVGGIARHYGTSVHALAEVNGLRGASVRTGSALLVPVGAHAVASYEPSPEMQRVLARNAARAGPARIHVVRSGENPWVIARRYHVPLRRLLAWNGLHGNSILHPGQRLRLHGVRAVPVATNGGGEDDDARRRVYVVRRGDNLSLIAVRHGVSIARLAAWNDIERSDLLHPGQRLFIGPATASPAVASSEPRRISYTVRRGDSLWFISQRFNVSVASLRRWNTLSRGELLHPGQKLDVFLPAGTVLHEG